MNDLLAFYFSVTLYRVSSWSYTKVVVSISTTLYCSFTHVCILLKKENYSSVCCFTFFCFLSFLTLSFIQLITTKVKHKDKSWFFRDAACSTVDRADHLPTMPRHPGLPDRCAVRALPDVHGRHAGSAVQRYLRMLPLYSYSSAEHEPGHVSTMPHGDVDSG